MHGNNYGDAIELKENKNSSKACLKLTSIDLVVYPVDVGADTCGYCVVIGTALFVTPTNDTPDDPSSRPLLTNQWPTTVSLASTLKSKYKYS